MTIDKTIEHARAIAKYKRKKLDKCIKKNIYACKFCNEIRSCKEVAEENEQLVEWLEELKAYQQQHIALCEKYSVNTIEDLYEKGIDDFTERLKPIIDEKIKGWTNSDDSRRWCERSINELAEQLKKGERY